MGVGVGSQAMFCWLGTVPMFCVGAKMQDCVGVDVGIDCFCCSAAGGCVGDDCLNSVFGLDAVGFAPGFKLKRSNSSTGSGSGLKAGSGLKVLAVSGSCAGLGTGIGLGIGIEG